MKNPGRFRGRGLIAYRRCLNGTYRTYGTYIPRHALSRRFASLDHARGFREPPAVTVGPVRPVGRLFHHSHRLSRDQTTQCPNCLTRPTRPTAPVLLAAVRIRVSAPRIKNPGRDIAVGVVFYWFKGFRFKGFRRRADGAMA